MSRIGKLPIPIPSGVKVDINENNEIRVKGPKGELSRTLHKDMKVEKTDKQITVQRPSDEGSHRALHGLTRTLINNMVMGVSEGFTRELEIVGVGYKAAKQGNALQIHIGYSHPVLREPPTGIEFDVVSVRGAGFTLFVKGADKELVGQVSAELRAIRPPEPYKGKGIKYKGEVIRRKMGKAGKTAK